MSPKVNELVKSALELDSGERAELIEQLFASFESPDRERVDALWAREAEDRIDAYNRGEFGSKPAAEVLRNLRRNNS